jgi:hypothetical protein
MKKDDANGLKIIYSVIYLRNNMVSDILTSREIIQIIIAADKFNYFVIFKYANGY